MTNFGGKIPKTSNNLVHNVETMNSLSPNTSKTFDRWTCTSATVGFFCGVTAAKMHKITNRKCRRLHHQFATRNWLTQVTNYLQWRPDVDRCPWCRGCPLTSVVCNGQQRLSILWWCPPMIYTVFLCDDYYLLLPVERFLAWWCLTVTIRSSWRLTRIMTGCHTYLFVLCTLYDLWSILL